MLLHVVGRPARAGRGVTAAEPLHVQRDRLVGTLRRLEDRPVAAMTKWVARSRRDDALRERRIAGAGVELADRKGGVLLRHHNAGAQSRLRLDEGLQLPVVDGAR